MVCGINSEDFLKVVPTDQKSEHFKKLSTARERVIAECRKLAALNGPHERHRSEKLDVGFMAVQNTIDEINRVLTDKTPIPSGKVLSFPIRTLYQPATAKVSKKNDGSVAVRPGPSGTPVQLRPRKMSRS